MRDWNDVLPPDVARWQHQWERKVSAARMRRAGLTLKQVGLRLGVGVERARQLAERGELTLRFPTVRKAPTERYLMQQDYWKSSLGGKLRLSRVLD